jgi:hypothetical protein
VRFPHLAHLVTAASAWNPTSLLATMIRREHIGR